MHSIEAIIAIGFLISFFGICIITISIQNHEFNFYKEKFDSLNNANYCATIIDFSFIESIKEIKIENCFGNENLIYVDSLKKSYSIVKVEKQGSLLVEQNEHYIK